MVNLLQTEALHKNILIWIFKQYRILLMCQPTKKFQFFLLSSISKKKTVHKLPSFTINQKGHYTALYPIQQPHSTKENFPINLSSVFRCFQLFGISREQLWREREKKTKREKITRASWTWRNAKWNASQQQSGWTNTTLHWFKCKTWMGKYQNNISRYRSRRVRIIIKT